MNNPEQQSEQTLVAEILADVKIHVGTTTKAIRTRLAGHRPGLHKKDVNKVLYRALGVGRVRKEVEPDAEQTAPNWYPA